MLLLSSQAVKDTANNRINRIYNFFIIVVLNAKGRVICPAFYLIVVLFERKVLYD